jgi:hypothetical protein
MGGDIYPLSGAGIPCNAWLALDGMETAKTAKRNTLTATHSPTDSGKEAIDNRSRFDFGQAGAFRDDIDDLRFRQYPGFIHYTLLKKVGGILRDAMPTGAMPAATGMRPGMAIHLGNAAGARWRCGKK